MATSKLRGAADSVDVGVSADGTWLHILEWSYNSYIYSGKVLDNEILSKLWKGSTRMQAIKAKDPHVYYK